jgi:transposase
MGIWQDMVTDHGFSGAYNTVKRFVRKLRGADQPKAVGIILTGPGEESQVDYGAGRLVRDPQSGKYRRTRLFVMTLGYSRKAVRLLVFRSSTRTWAELHETAFRRLGGSCRVLILDNLKEGVLTPDIYDPAQSTLQGRADALRSGGDALPGPRSQPERQGRIWRGTRAENAAEGHAL